MGKVGNSLNVKFIWSEFIGIKQTMEFPSFLHEAGDEHTPHLLSQGKGQQKNSLQRLGGDFSQKETINDGGFLKYRISKAPQCCSLNADLK